MSFHPRQSKLRVISVRITTPELCPKPERSPAMNTTASIAAETAENRACHLPFSRQSWLRNPRNPAISRVLLLCKSVRAMRTHKRDWGQKERVRSHQPFSLYASSLAPLTCPFPAKHAHGRPVITLFHASSRIKSRTKEPLFGAPTALSGRLLFSTWIFAFHAHKTRVWPSLHLSGFLR